MNESLHTNDFINKAVSQYADMLFRVCFTYLNNVQDAEDIAQDTLLKLVEKQPVFEHEEHQKAWLLRVAVNLCKNRLRSAWYRKKQPLNKNDFLNNIESKNPLTSEEFNVLLAVQKLPLKYRSVIHMFYIEGYSISEISSILKRKESTVGSQLHRARKILKSMLKEDFDE
ncbi:MAG TPA: sigma-70 family RNA polymerase sigma factor [Clostridiales bacterium]|nr:sigma-70 family RNA polymerase sigma factor [Clostridiales bacterium]